MLCNLIVCRDDGLELRHWVKGYKDANGRIRDAQEGDYAFAKYNKKVSSTSMTCSYILLVCSKAVAQKKVTIANVATASCS
jgi:hypothetical protein